MTDADRLAAAALDLVGTPFRLGGRDPAIGLDCFGVLHAALAAIGRLPTLPTDYRLRRLGLPDLSPWLAANGMRAAVGPDRPGDVRLCRVGPAQPHCVILKAGGFVHAQLALGRVVATPGTPPWAALCRARLICT